MHFLHTQDAPRPWSCEQASLAYGVLAAPNGLSLARRVEALQNAELPMLDPNERSRLLSRPLLVDVLALAPPGSLANSGRTMVVLQGWPVEEKAAFRLLVEHLLTLGADPSLQDGQGRDALDQALLVGDMAIIEQVAQAWPPGKPLRLDDRVYTVANDRMPALHWAVHASTPGMVKWLLAHGAAPDHQDARGWPALWHAQRIDMVEVLHSGGANLQLRVKGKRLPALFLPNDKASQDVASRWHALLHHSRDGLSAEEVDAVASVVCSTMSLSTIKEFARQWKIRGSSMGVHGSVLGQVSTARLLKDDQKGEPLLKWCVDTAQVIQESEVSEVLWATASLFPSALGQKAMLGQLGLLSTSPQAKARWARVVEGLADIGPWQRRRGWRHRVANLLAGPLNQFLPLGMPVGDGGIPLVWALLQRMGGGLYAPDHEGSPSFKRTVEEIARGHGELGKLLLGLPDTVLRHPLAFSCVLPLIATPAPPVDGPLVEACRRVASHVACVDQLPVDIHQLLQRLVDAPRHLAGIAESVLLQTDTKIPTASRSAHRL